MARQDRDEVTLIDAAREMGITRAALYGRVLRARKRGEAVPFRKSAPGGRLAAGRKELDAWVAQWAVTAGAPKAPVTAARQEPRMTQEDKAIKIPSSSSGNAVGDPLAASAETTAAPASREPIPTVGAPVIDELPSSYMENRVTTLLHGPDRIAVYWDVHPETAKAHAGGRWGILVRTASGETVIEIEHGARNWYIDLPGIGLAHDIDFGPIVDGTVRSIAHTGVVPESPAADEITWGAAGSDVRWGRQETVGETSLVSEPASSGDAVDIAHVNAEELRRASSAAGRSGSSGELSSPGLSRSGA
ncbi:hypothetical protein HN371_18230 [Candidatus Poribacteria bacterium]|jgi:hypothetical protein|nr:hypothetical protein [Candidatus Poribacteria bacterium]MBT5534695.1 hypothetical protein [Candidatus Poribacteria bacterium]MBT5711065.1 hypothetical protein [Candidatus Poribacteria bacterium]MBT7098937.1 hypothetical protein [Candidatus Poribacteria bacterium]MBT7809354.1 hypothetical protein [Candidatus Poribacteria bacterium]